MKKQSVLSPNHKRQLTAASRQSVERYFTELSPLDRRTRWLDAGNRYRVECVRTYENDLITTPSAVDHSAIRNYVAASAPTHVFDGWSFVGRAIDSLLRGDSSAAIHLGYYAELRAAMSVLASFGIGVFNSAHCIVREKKTTPIPRVTTTKTKVKKISPQLRTHRFVWPCLEHWASRVPSFDLVEEVYQPGGFPLSEWFKGCGVGMPARVVTSRILRTWGIDLKDLGEDQWLRNLASYRPTELRPVPPLDVHEILRFVSDLWECFEPGSPGEFPTLERILLRKALHAVGIKTPTIGQLQQIGMSPEQAAQWNSQLDLTTIPDAILQAEKRATIDDPECCLQVISRATLLLTVATASVRQHLAKSGYSQADLRFSWQGRGVCRGLWDTTDTPVRPSDAWADVRDTLSEVWNWQSGNANGASLSKWRRENGGSVQILGAFELVAIWGLMPS